MGSLRDGERLRDRVARLKKDKKGPNRKKKVDRTSLKAYILALFVIRNLFIHRFDPVSREVEWRSGKVKKDMAKRGDLRKLSFARHRGTS